MGEDVAPASAAAGQSDRYLLGASAAEVEHLIRQAEVYAEEARQLLDRVRITAGASVIDVGCGVLGIVDLLCARVGPQGRVVGVDREPRMLDAARQVAAQRGLSADFLLGDATDLVLPPDSFDLVHERTVLLNVADPARVVAEMIRITRPGGVIALQEPDSSAWVCDPPHPAWGLLRAELLDAYRRNGKNFDMGRRIARLLRDAGLADVRVRATARVTNAADYYQTFLLTLTSLVRDQIIAGQRVSAAEFDAHSASLRAHLQQPDTLTCQPTIWQAWGTKA
ncbi:MAG TPA: methyltransferase domain-containing protein [Streptosporangiaceae bacterium]